MELVPVPDSASNGITPQPEVRFLIFGLPDRRSLYEATIAKAEFDCEFHDSVEELIAACMRRSPTAVFIEQSVVVRNQSRIGFLFRMSVSYPFLRFNIGSDGSGVVMSMNPPKREEYAVAIPAIAAGEPSWFPTEECRSSIRIPVKCRAEIQAEGSDEWTRGNIQDICQGGCFISLLDPPEVGSRIQIKIHDFAEKPESMEATVIWNQAWDDSPELPGAGLHWDVDTRPAGFVKALGSPESVAAVMQSFR
jgi:hypothetical protein